MNSSPACKARFYTPYVRLVAVDDEPHISARWRQWRREIDLDEYENRWDRREADGEDVHGEADFVDRYAKQRVLDAGCGMGRVGLELARRGYDVVGVDNDPEMLERAKSKNSDAQWVLGDLSQIAFDTPFDTIVLAGNVLVFVEPARRHLVVPNLVQYLTPGGHLIAGSEFAPGFDLAGYDDWCYFADLELIERYGAWDRQPFNQDRDYAVSVHRLPADGEP